MKVIIEKKLEGGKYSVQINVSNYTADEVDKIKRFGSPNISIAPQTVWSRDYGTRLTSLPLHDMNYDFKFTAEAEAVSFVNNMTDRIKLAVDKLKGMRDQFSGTKELEL